MANPPTTPKSKRRWVQFSLRTGFIVVTGMCVALSLWIVPLERKRRAVAAIEAFGGSVEYVGQEANAPRGPAASFLRRLVPRDYFDEVRGVDLSDSRVTDAGMSHLVELPSLRQLSLVDTNVTDVGLVHLRRLTRLKSLRLSGTQVTGAGLVNVERLTDLEYLILDRLNVTDAGLAHLQGLKKLKGLSLWGAPIEHGLVYFQGLTSLEVLYLVGTQLTKAEVAQLREALPTCRVYGP